MMVNDERCVLLSSQVNSTTTTPSPSLSSSSAMQSKAMAAPLTADDLLFLSTWLRPSNRTATTSAIDTVSSLLAAYDVPATASRLLSAAANRSNPTTPFNVALQFPDHLLPHAPLILESLRLLTSPAPLFLFLLADTSYGECCADEVAADHLSAHLLVHYGPACLSPTRALPVLYVFPSPIFPHPAAARAALVAAVHHLLARLPADRLVLFYDTALAPTFRSAAFAPSHIQPPLTPADLAPDGKHVHFAALRLPDPAHIVPPGPPPADSSDSKVFVGPLSFDRGPAPLSRTAFLWLSLDPPSPDDDWPPAARNAALQLCTGPHPTCAGFFATSLTPSPTGQPPVLVDAARVLRRRLAVVSKLSEVQRFGIVPGTLGVSGNLEVIERCKRVIKSAGKRAYVMLVGKPNPSKLANFAEIDAFVLVACPQNALLDGREYMQPIITPMELEATLLADGDIFSEPYSVDFRDLLEKKLDLEDENDIEESPNSNSDESAVALRGDWSVSVTGEGSAAEFLKSRHWQGLSYGTGGADDATKVADLPLKATLGQTGIASKYDNEVKQTDEQTP